MRVFKLLLNPKLQLWFFALVALGLLVELVWFAPVQVPVIGYKLALVTVAAILGVFFDSAVFPFANPASYLEDDWQKHPDANNFCDADYPIVSGYKKVFVGASLRRAMIIAAFVLAVSLGL